MVSTVESLRLPKPRFRLLFYSAILSYDLKKVKKSLLLVLKLLLYPPWFRLESYAKNTLNDSLWVRKPGNKYSARAHQHGPCCCTRVPVLIFCLGINKPFPGTFSHGPCLCTRVPVWILCLKFKLAFPATFQHGPCCSTRVPVLTSELSFSRLLLSTRARHKFLSFHCITWTTTLPTSA